MKARYLVLGAVALALLVGSAVLAGEHGPRGEGGMRGMLGPMGFALDRLELTQAQRDQIEAIVAEQRPAVKELREQLRAGQEKFLQSQSPTEVDEAAIRAHVAEQSKVMADLEVAMAKLRARVFTVLTAEQRTQLEQMRARRHEHMAHGERPRGEL